MQEKTLKKLFSISLKARILRTWQSANTAGDKELSEKEILLLELIEAFPGIAITEQKISKIFAISPSSVNDLVKKLIALDLLQKKTEGGITRGKEVTITDRGRDALGKINESGAARFSFMFSQIDNKEWEIIEKLLIKIDAATTDAIKKNIFDIWA